MTLDAIASMLRTVPDDALKEGTQNRFRSRVLDSRRSSNDAATSALRLRTGHLRRLSQRCFQSSGRTCLPTRVNRLFRRNRLPLRSCRRRLSISTKAGMYRFRPTAGTGPIRT